MGGEEGKGVWSNFVVGKATREHPGALEPAFQLHPRASQVFKERKSQLSLYIFQPGGFMASISLCSLFHFPITFPFPCPQQWLQPSGPCGPRYKDSAFSSLGWCKRQKTIPRFSSWWNIVANPTPPSFARTAALFGIGGLKLSLSASSLQRLLYLLSIPN